MIGKIKRYPNRYPKMFATLHEHPMFTNTKTFFLRSGCHTTERLYWSDFKSGRVNRLLKIQYSPLVRPCFETEKARLKIAFSLRFVFASKQKTTSAKLRRSVYFLALPSRFDQKQTASQNRQNSVTDAFHLAATVSLSSETKPTRTLIFASLFAKLRKLTKCLFLGVRSLFDWAAPPTLATGFHNFANANPANPANRRVRFQI